MPAPHAAHAVPSTCPTPPRFVGTVLSFLVIAAIDRVARRIVERLNRRRETPQVSGPRPAVIRRQREAHQ